MTTMKHDSKCKRCLKYVPLAKNGHSLWQCSIQAKPVGCANNFAQIPEFRVIRQADPKETEEDTMMMQRALCHAFNLK